MAAFLNKPSDFTTKPVTKEEPLTLLPPSAFEKPRTSVPGGQRDGQLKKVTEEISALKIENQKLKDRLDGSVWEMASGRPAGSGQPPLPPNDRRLADSRHYSSDRHFVDDRRYADELISRQAEELSELRSQVKRLESDLDTTREDCRRRLEAGEGEREERVAALTHTLRTTDLQHTQEVSDLNQRHEGEVLDLTSRLQQQVSDLNQRHEGEVLDLTSRLQHLSEELERSKGDLTSQVTDLTSDLCSLRQHAKDTEDSLRQQLRDGEGEVSDQRREVQQLRTYITDSEEQHRPLQVWRQQCQTLTNRLQVSEAEKQTLQSSVELLNVRLSAVKDILHTHESQLVKGKEEIMDKSKVKELLLTRWRQKVYSLLVQQKSGEMVRHRDLHTWKEKTAQLEDQLWSAHNTVSILRKTVEEKDADLQLAHNRHKEVDVQRRQAEEVVVSVEERISRDGASIMHLADFAHSVEGRLQQQASSWQQALGQLTSLGHRVTFAASRMDLLQGQLKRKVALQQLGEGQTTPSDAQALDTDQTWRQERDQLREELSQVMGERDMLVGQLEHDSHTFTANITALRSHYDAEVSSLKRTVEDLETANQEKAQLLDGVSQQLEGTSSDLQEARECRDDLGTQLARHNTTLQQALEDQRGRLEDMFREQLADLERQVNNARREHTKAVVTLRQQQRQWERERARGEEERGVVEGHYQTQITALQQHGLTLERDRNLFMATLRQEGLLAKVHGERREPISLALEERGEGGEVQRGEGVVTPEQCDSSATQVTLTDSLNSPHHSSEPVLAVLEDLKSLVPALLDDSPEEDEDSEGL